MASERWISIGQFASDRSVSIEYLPRTIRIILESALRAHAEGRLELSEVENILHWRHSSAAIQEITFPIGRVIMQDAAGLPVLLDLASLRSISRSHTERIRLAVPATLVVDHSIQVDFHRTPDALSRNLALEFERNKERFQFLKWASEYFDGLDIVPPGNGIVHQIHLESIAKVVDCRNGWMFIDTVIGTDSHTPMVNALGVLGWGVGGIEAQSALVGDFQCIAAPEVVGIELAGHMAPHVGAADVALALTNFLRKQDVTGCFLEFYGDGAARLEVSDRATISNMAPEYGASTALFPVDENTLNFLRRHGRSAEDIARIRRHLTRQTLFGHEGLDKIAYSRRLRFDLDEVQPVLAGPSRPDQMIPLGALGRTITSMTSNARSRAPKLVLASITSCTNTANPASMITAGLLARNATARGLSVAADIKTSLAPGSRLVVEYLKKIDLLNPLERLGFNVVAFGCATCVGNSGPLPVLENEAEQPYAAILSGNRNFEGRIHKNIRHAYLASPALVVAYAIAGALTIDIGSDPLGFDDAGQPVMLRDIWPSRAEVEAALAEVDRFINSEHSGNRVVTNEWGSLAAIANEAFPAASNSTYLIPPPFFELPVGSRLNPILDARPLLILGDSITTDHISPVGSISHQHDAGRYLLECGVKATDFNTYAARRGNHEVMVRGTFANAQLRNMLVAEPGPATRHLPSGKIGSIYEIAKIYESEKRDTVILAGHGYGTGSARDWAAKGTRLLGVRAVVARGFERIHRSNLVRLGVLPIQLVSAFNFSELAGARDISVTVEFDDPVASRHSVIVKVVADGVSHALEAVLRVDTSRERDYLLAGSLFQYSLDKLVPRREKSA